eukprot:4159607-Amphidinium_carterae.1
MDDLTDAQRASVAPGRVVLSLKPVDTTGGVRGENARRELSFAGISCFLNILVRRDWQLAVLDVPGAFLHADLTDRDVFLTPPKLLAEFGVTEAGRCWKLKKALYGLKEAPRLWQSRRDADLAALRFWVEVEGRM